MTHGWGPGFNATENVQAYTHPLWFLSWLAIGVVTNQWIIGVLVMGIIFSVGASALIFWRTATIARLIVVTGLLVMSNAFVEYATSGLENSLAYLTVGVLIAMTLKGFPNTGRRAYLDMAILGLLSAAVFLTRFDLLVLIVPILVYVIWQQRTLWRGLLVLAATFVIPLVIWFGWSQFTYSSWLPNTFAAKRNVDIPATELIIQGLRYLMVSFENDPVTLLALVLGIGAALFLGTRVIRLWGIGTLLYLAYVVWIGGDFMAGRFLAVPVYVAVFMLAVVTWKSPKGDGTEVTAQEATAVAGIGAIALIAFLSGSTPVAFSNPQGARWEAEQNVNAGVSDERGIYVANNRSLNELIDNLSLAYIDPDLVPYGDGTGLNRSLRNLSKTAQNWPVSDGFFTLPSEVADVCGFLGTVGIVTGPTVHYVDTCALTDRFLAEQPFTPAEPFAWKPGHFHRAVPEGYLDAIRTNDPALVQDRVLAFELEKLWAKIRPID
jgi:arabinofuranosyltransferase